tara:strand:- start:426 stop:1034 length:609 start_codon:yes stop_codon:yes gene_type:complete
MARINSRATVAKLMRHRPHLPLPPLVFITDRQRQPHPEVVVSALPRGSAVLFRDYGLLDRKLLGKKLEALCRKKQLIFLVAGDGGLAHNLSANGIHLREVHIQKVPYWRSKHPNWLITVAAHSEAALHKAARAGADAALVSPVFKTQSHPEAKALGTTRLRRLVARSPIPVYALGGVNRRTQQLLKNIGLCGLAGISSFDQE